MNEDTLRKKPSVMRYDRVQQIIESDRALAAYLGPKDQEIEKRNGEKNYYRRGVVIVTEALHAKGVDATRRAKSPSCA
jgi:hypothetical protein